MHGICLAMLQVLKKKNPYIIKALSVFILVVFAIALTPWSTFHHHEEQPTIKAEKHCTHDVHVKAQNETCLVCSAHFEKNYVSTHTLYKVFLSVKLFSRSNAILKRSFTDIIGTSLRGPPLA